LKIIIFSHPNFIASQSMPRFTNMLFTGLQRRGHEVKIWSPKSFFSRLPMIFFLKKWMGYIDQYIMFPIEVIFKLNKSYSDTLYVFSDQALGPWVPLVKNRPHVIHCHDFLALRSSIGEIPENPISFTGKIYQRFIQNGFSKGENFISVSEKTHEDLLKYHKGKIKSANVCYNGMNRDFKRFNQKQSRLTLGYHLNINLSLGYIMHIGGNDYYKNRLGVLEIYEEFRLNTSISIPLLLIGSKPNNSLKDYYIKSTFKKDIYFIHGLGDEFINYIYSGATCLLFPSLDEGFGWPIAEAMASGCIVVTTNTSPMNEVNGDANFFNIPRKNSIYPDTVWAKICSENIIKITNLSDFEREEYIKIGLESVKRFESQKALDKIETIYKTIILN